MVKSPMFPTSEPTSIRRKLVKWFSKGLLAVPSFGEKDRFPRQKEFAPKCKQRLAPKALTTTQDLISERLGATNPSMFRGTKR